VTQDPFAPAPFDTPPSPDDHDDYRAYCEWLGVAYIPGFVQRMPEWNENAFLLPCCMRLVSDPVPKRGARCKACMDPFYIRSCPDGVKRVLTRTAMIEVECLWAEINVVASSSYVIAAPRSVSISETIEDGKRELRKQARQSIAAKYQRF